MGGNPDDKRRSWGGLFGGKDAQRQAKGYKATGKVSPAKRTRGNGAQELGARRFFRDLFKDDDN